LQLRLPAFGQGSARRAASDHASAWHRHDHDRVDRRSVAAVITGPTLYKARGVPNKQNVCAICVDRTRGRTAEVDLGHGVRVWLCAAHASLEFQMQRGGRDFVLTLSRLWHAHGCMTQPRQRALNRHLAARKPQPSGAGKPRPGSYAWPQIRARVERALAAGTPLQTIARGLADPRLFGRARPPSHATLLRWKRERRWLSTRPP
jgi:hypothetical protein